MRGSRSERREMFCDGLGSNIVAQYSVGPVITLHNRITAREYMDRLGNQMHPMIQTLCPNDHAAIQDDNAPIHTAAAVHHGLKSMKVNFSIFPGQPQPPHLNTIEPLWSSFGN
jgi:hypothetical protein